MERIDDRTTEQLKTHRWLVVGTDSFLFGRGRASGGTSVAAWACMDLYQARLVEMRVRQRSDMKRVRIVHETESKTGKHKLYRPRAAARFHVYVADDR